MSRYIEDQDWDSISAAFIISAFFSAFILILMRGITYRILHKTHLGGIPAVIYGSGKTGRLLVDCLLGSIRAGYIPVLILDDDAASDGDASGGIDEYRGIPVIHDTGIGRELVSRYNIKMAMVAMPKLEEKKLKHLMNNSVSAFRYNAFIPDFASAATIWMSIRDFDGMLGFVSSQKLKMPWNRAFKRFLDISFVVLGGLIISPLLLLITLLIKASSPGPVLYKHRRLGMNGKPFSAYKFRSMVIDADERLKALLKTDAEAKKEWGANHKLRKDPRITGIGRILRRSSFDEFPQLLNILKGEMSLVGPRPIVDEEAIKYGEDFQRIFSVKPGLTGLWQVSGRSDINYQERVSYDTYYLQSWSAWLDIWILIKTFGAVIFGRGAY